MDKIKFTLSETDEAVDFFVLEETKINGIQYILVTDKEEGNAEGYILKDTSAAEDAEAVYEMVEEEKELEVISKVFEQMLDDVDFEM